MYARGQTVHKKNDCPIESQWFGRSLPSCKKKLIISGSLLFDSFHLVFELALMAAAIYLHNVT